VLPEKPLSWDLPIVQGLNLSGGKILSPEFMALTSGLVLYTAAFIGEVVRAGIQSVSRGQVEASRALGLNAFQTLRLIVFPQALRVIIPPLTSQYLNLVKNSSLAIAVGYPDVFYVSNTIQNQTGRAVEMIALVMFTYLSISLLTSVLMNWYNQRIRLVER
jgi:general L-amino acid transport system permease protein